MNYIQRFVQDKDNSIKAIRALVMMGILIALINTLTIKSYIIYIFPIALFIMAGIIQYYLSNHNKYTEDMIKYLESHENYSKLYVRFTGRDNFDDKLIMSINGDDYTLGKDNYGIFIFIDYSDEETEIIIDEEELFSRLGLDINPSEIRVSRVVKEVERGNIERIEKKASDFIVNIKDKFKIEEDTDIEVPIMEADELETKYEEREEIEIDIGTEETEEIETEDIETEDTELETNKELELEETEEKEIEEREKVEIKVEEEIITGQMVKYHFKGDFGRYLIRYDQLTDNYYINYFY